MGIKLSQTAPSTGLLTSPWEQTTLFPLAVLGRDTNSSSLSETSHAGCGCCPGPSHPHDHDMWSSLRLRPSTDVTSCSAVHERHCQTPAILLPVSGSASCPKLRLLMMGLFFRNVYRWSDGPVPTHVKTEAGRTNAFSLKMSSSLNLIITRFLNAPPVAFPRLIPTPPCHNRSGVDRQLWGER